MPERIKLVIVGLNFGRSIVEAELLNGGPGQETIELVGLCDCNQAKACDLADKHGLKVYTDFDEVINDSSIDAIGLYTAPHGRAKLIESALRHGKAVMTTKPFEDDAAAAEEVLNLSVALALPVHLNSPAPERSSDIAQILDWQKQYSLGEMVFAFWETHANYRELADNSWMDDPDLCPAAPVFRLGVYGINELIELGGKVTSSQVMSTRTSTGRPTADNSVLSVKFANGALGCVAASFRVDNAQPYLNTILLNYENGTISRAIPGTVVDGADFILTLQTKTDDGRKIIETKHLSPGNRAGAYQWKCFSNAVINQQPIMHDYLMRIVESVEILEGLRNGQ